MALAYGWCEENDLKYPVFDMNSEPDVQIMTENREQMLSELEVYKHAGLDNAVNKFSLVGVHANT